jgi:DNA polymerase-4
VGPRAEERLAAAGIATLGGLASLSDAELRAVLPGQVGRLLRDRARGIDPRDLELDAERISISTEETFERDLTERHALHAELRRMAEDVAAHLRRDGLSARTVTTKLRYSDFSIRSRSTTLPTPIDEPERIGALACSLLDRGLRDRPGALRLVGVGVSGLTGARQLSLDEL